MRIIVCDNYDLLSKKAAQIVGSQMILNPKSILGLATGSTPIGMYKNLIKMYEEGLIDFSKTTTFNLDEYYQLPINNDQSYHYFMDENLFNHININRENIHIPNGMADDFDEMTNLSKALREKLKKNYEILKKMMNMMRKQILMIIFMMKMMMKIYINK